MTVRTEFNTKFGTSPKHPCGNDAILAYSALSNNNKRPCEQYTQPTSHPICDNEYCERPVGHLRKDCFAYKGGKQGQYPEWFRGSKLVHLPPNERARIRREDKIMKTNSRQFRQPNANPPSYSSSTPRITPSNSTSTAYNATITPSCSQFDAVDSADSSDAVHANLTQDSISQIVLNTYIPPIHESQADTVCRCSPTVFNTSIC